MNKALIMLIIGVFFSCQTKLKLSNKYSKVLFEILNENIYNGDTIRLKITNLENKRIYIPIDFNLKDSYFSSDGLKKNYYPHFLIYQNDSLVWPSINISSIHGPFFKTVESFLINTESLISIEKSDSKIIHLPFSNFEKIPNSEIETRLFVDKPGTYDFKINYILNNFSSSKHLKTEYGIYVNKNQLINSNFYSNSVKLIINN